MKHVHYKAYAAEFLGTAILTCAVLTSLTTQLPLATPLIAGLTLGLFVYTIGGISGAQVNPAVTLGLWSVGKMKTQEALLYILAQLLGATFAMQVHLNWLQSYPSVAIEDTLTVGVAEAVGAFLLVFAVSAVVHKKVNDCSSGLVIGGSLSLGALIASASSNGVLNPAVAIGIGSVSLSYLLGPIVGGILGAVSYKLLISK